MSPKVPPSSQEPSVRSDSIIQPTPTKGKKLNGQHTVQSSWKIKDTTVQLFKKVFSKKSTEYPQTEAQEEEKLSLNEKNLFLKFGQKRLQAVSQDFEKMTFKEKFKLLALEYLMNGSSRKAAYVKAFFSCLTFPKHGILSTIQNPATYQQVSDAVNTFQANIETNIAGTINPSINLTDCVTFLKTLHDIFEKTHSSHDKKILINIYNETLFFIDKAKKHLTTTGDPKSWNQYVDDQNSWKWD